MITRRTLLLSAALLPLAALPLRAEEWALRPFMLEDVNGAIVDDGTLLGRFALVFFGYTNCPDVCPTTLLTISTALKALDKKDADRVLPLFVTLDPERDTRKVLSDYVASFDPRLVALRGPKAYVDAAAGVFGITYKVVTPEPAKPAEYSVDHTATITLLDPSGKLVKRFSNTVAPDILARELRAAIAAVPPATAAPAPQE